MCGQQQKVNSVFCRISLKAFELLIQNDRKNGILIYVIKYLNSVKQYFLLLIIVVFSLLFDFMLSIDFATIFKQNFAGQSGGNPN